MGRAALFLATLIGFSALSSCATAPEQPPARTYTNPVLDTDFPDPAVLKAGDGFYYAYATQTGREGRTINIQTARSRDLSRWELLGDALPVKPGWASRTQDFWAPHVSEHGDRYYLYYSAKPDAALADPAQGLCLAVATADRPEGPFADSGKPLQCGPSFFNIDPMAFDDPATGKRLLYWGSRRGPIKVRELAPDRLSFAEGSAPIELVQPSPAEYHGLIEGAWLLRRGGFYYLFYSGDNCCGPGAHYAVMVARSRSATGPFETKSGTVVEATGKWLAPGHNSVIEDERGEAWMLYHAVDRSRPRSTPAADINTRRVMLIDRIVWKDGWPRLATGAPSETPQPSPAR
jgi:arabinan endo-1,5-alpha-L-arabinosidase